MKTKINNYQKEQKELAITLEFLLGSYTKSVLDKAKYLIQKLNKQTKQLTNNKLITNTVLTTIFILSLALITSLIFKPNYNLSQADIKLTGSVDQVLLNDTKYNGQKKSWSFADNESINQISVGSSSQYSYTVNSNLDKGITLKDTKSSSIITIAPLFNTYKGKMVDGRFVYPVNSTITTVYTVKANGLQEDVILSKKLSYLTLKYNVEIPKSLKARRLPSGAVGIFKGNNLVFGLTPPSIKQSGDGRNHATAKFILKGHQLTTIATGLSNLIYPISIDPTVIDYNASTFALGNSSNLSISNNGISITGLVGGDICTAGCTGSLNGWQTPNNNASYFASGFTPVAYAGNAIFNNTLYVVGGCITVSSNCDTPTNIIQYAPIATSGYGFSSSQSWIKDTSLPVSVYRAGVTTYNGYLYVVGGCTSITCTGVSDNIYYRQLNPNGGGFLGNSSWQSMGLPSTYNNGTVAGGYGISVTSFDDFIYILGGCTANTGTGTSAVCTATNYVWHGELNGDGSFTLNQDTLYPFNTPRFDAGAYAYNNYLYLVGGCTSLSSGTCTPQNDIQYAAITPVNYNGGAPGALADAWQTSANSLSVGIYAFGLTVTSNYMYVIGGCSSINSSSVSQCSKTQDTVQYANLKADGGTSAWFMDATTLLNSSTSAPDGLSGVSINANNNFIYTSGGSDGANLNGITFASIDLNLAGSGWQIANNGNGSLPVENVSGSIWVTPSIGSGVVEYTSPTGKNYAYYAEGFAYYSGTTVYGPSGRIFLDPLNTMTSTSSSPTQYFVGTLSTPVSNFGMALSGNYLYIIDGCKQWSASDLNNVNPASWACAATTNIVQYFEINPNNGALCTPGGTNCTGTGCPNTIGANASITQYQDCTFGYNSSTAPATAPSWDPIAIQCGTCLNHSGVYGDSAVAINNFQGSNYLVTELGFDSLYGQATTEGGVLSLYNDGSVKGTAWQASVATNLGTSSLYGGNLIYDPDNQYLYYLGGINAELGTSNDQHGYAQNKLLYDSVSNVISNNGGWITATNTCSTGVYWCTYGIAFTAAGYANGSIYYAGGLTASAPQGDNTVDISETVAVNNDGSVGTWQKNGNLQNTAANDGVARLAGMIANGYMFALGGDFCQCGGPSLSDSGLPFIWFNKLGNFSSGYISDWVTNQSTDNLPVTLTNEQSLTYNNTVYVLGGVTNNGSSNSSPTSVSNTVYFADTIPGGGIGPPPSSACTPISGTIWCSESLPNPTYDFGAVVINGYIYIAGGCSAYGSSFTPVTDNCATLINGNNIYYSKISPNGSLVAPSGCTQIGTTAWCSSSASSPITNGEFGLNMDTYNGYIYLLGGCNAVSSSVCTSTSYSNTVYFAAINTSVGSNGALSINSGCGSTWCTASNNFTLGRFAASSLTYDGYIYILGGYNSNDTGTCSSSWAPDYCYDVQYAPICSATVTTSGCKSGVNGDLGTWNYTKSLGSAADFLSISAYNGFFYIWGGSSNGYTGYGQYYPINSDGTFYLSQTISPEYSAAQGTITANGFLYSLGGYSPGNTSNSPNYGWSSSVETAGIESMPKVGYYSQLIDLGTHGLGGDATPDFITLTGNNYISSSSTINPNQNFNPTNSGEIGGVTALYMDGVGQGTCANQITPKSLNYLTPNGFNSFSTLPRSMSLTFDGCGSSTQAARYIWIEYVIDDSQTYALTSSVPANVTQLTSFTLYYHPSPNARFMGGQTLVNGNKQSLDTIP